MIKINFEKAKEITKERLRADRVIFLQKQDIEFQKALETNSDTANIIAEKQRLRDITNLADKAKTLDDLKNISVE